MRECCMNYESGNKNAMQFNNPAIIRIEPAPFLSAIRNSLIIILFVKVYVAGSSKQNNVIAQS